MRYLCNPPRALAHLSRRSTFYEAALVRPNGSVAAALAYDAKRTKRALLCALMNHGPAIAVIAGVDSNDCAVSWNGDAWVIGDSGYRVAWSGATEYQRACEALPAIAA